LSISGIAAAKVYDELKEEAITALNFTQKLNHFDFFDNRTFIQRHWFNGQYWNNQTGPIFVYICGESTCRPPSERGYPF